jgi:hypothetical protein
MSNPYDKLTSSGISDEYKSSVRHFLEPSKDKDAQISDLQAQLAEANARSIETACDPWKYCVGNPPDYESPLQNVWQAAIVWMQELLAKHYGIAAYESEGATESLEGDAMVGFANIINQLTDARADEAIERCAKVCDEQQSEPECPERARYCAEAIRALKSAPAQPMEPIAYYDHFNDALYRGERAKEQAEAAEAGGNKITRYYGR